MSAGDGVRLHLLVGWSLLLVFVVLGGVLEALHGLKLSWYVAVSNETRRLMWTLAHAHGTLLALINVAFAFTLRVATLQGPRVRLASRCLLASSVLLPAGFFLGGIDVYAGDPGLGVLLVPAGAALLVVAVLVTTLETRTWSRSQATKEAEPS
jgi:hypothetical protein